jgi:hypothetical protein
MDLPGTGIQASSFRSTFDSYFRIVKGEDSDRESLLWKGQFRVFTASRNHRA